MKINNLLIALLFISLIFVTIKLNKNKIIGYSYVVMDTCYIERKEVLIIEKVIKIDSQIVKKNIQPVKIIKKEKNNIIKKDTVKFDFLYKIENDSNFSVIIDDSSN